MKILATGCATILSLFLTACDNGADIADESKPAATMPSNSASAVQESLPDSNLDATTTVTHGNYALAETQVIFTDYVKRIATGTNSNGVGILMHMKKGADPKDRTVMRINFDTIYSFAVVDLTEDATLTMPETNGRYQNTWLVTEEHYNPMSLDGPGEYTLTQENVGSRYVLLIVRTQANTANPDDIAQANELQAKLKLAQKDRGSYRASHNWDMEDILAMRAHYSQLTNDKGITSEVMFGKKGEVSLENHNAGTAFGWGGFTPDQAVYPGYTPTSIEHQTLTLENVPVRAFWSITVYDQQGYPQTDTYNINSQFAQANEDGTVTINFGGNSDANNYMEVFEGWNFILRMYQPTELYFNGQWTIPQLKLAK